MHPFPNLLNVHTISLPCNDLFVKPARSEITAEPATAQFLMSSGFGILSLASLRNGHFLARVRRGGGDRSPNVNTLV
jgi:hypothetical protein